MFDEGNRSHTFAWVAAALLLLAVGYRVLAGRAPDPPPVAVDAAPAALGAEPGPEGRARRAGKRVYVHVAGAVRRPGLYRLPDGARVAAALDRAGGPRRRANLAAVNLAARVADGQQVLVPVRGTAAAAGAATGAAGTAGAGGAAAGPISLATATQAQLEELDGIGPALASRIIEYRDSHGGFRSVDELGEVDGIGDVRLAALRKAVQP
jgi:competence protein ComEA